MNILYPYNLGIPKEVIQEMGQAKRRKDLGITPELLQKIFYKGKPLNRTKAKWILINHPESLKEMK